MGTITYKVTDNDKVYEAKLPSDYNPFAISFEPNGEFRIIAVRGTETSFWFKQSAMGIPHPNESPVKGTLLKFFKDKQHDINTIRLVSKHKSKKWCLVLIDDKVKGWFETELLISKD